MIDHASGDLEEGSKARPEAPSKPSEAEKGSTSTSSMSSSEFHRVLLDNMTEGVSLSTEGGTIIYTNPAEDRMFGYAAGELLGQHVSVQNAYAPDDNTRIVSQVIADLKGSGAWRGEWLNRRKDGSIFTTRSRISAVDIDGRPHWLCVQEDVAEERAAATALRESEARLRASEAHLGAVFTQATVGFAEVDLTGLFVRVNPRYCEILGRKPDELVGRLRMQDVTHPDDLGRNLELFQGLLRGETSFEIEKRYLRPDQTTVWVRNSVTAIRNNEGRIETVLAVTKDITQQRNAEAALRESEARFRLMADAVPQIVWITDSNGRTEFFNKHWSDYTGSPYEQTTAAEIAANFVHPDDAGPTVAAFDQARRTGTTFLVEHRIRSRTGEYRWFLVRGEPYRDQEVGEITRWFGASVDIHDRRQAEAALRESEARLTFLDRLAAETAALTEADAVLATTTRLLGEHLNLSVCAYADMDEDQDGFTIRGDWAAPGSNSIVGHYRLANFGTLTVKNLSTGLPLVVNDNLRELAPDEAATFQNIGIAATICMPLVKEGRLTALMAIHDRVPREWTEPELNLLREVTARSWAHVERVAAVAELRENEARLRDLNETLEARVTERTAERNQLWILSQDMLARADYGGMMSAVSPAWTRVLGWSEAELLTRPYGSFMHPEDIGPTLAALARMGETGRPARFENRIATSDGGWKPIEWTVAPEPDDAKFIAVGRDLSEMRAREAELEAAQEALRQSQKMDAMGQLTGGVAHDFNNLLTPIIGSLDMLMRRGVGSERERRMMDGALQSAERAKTLVQRLLAFARRQPLQTSAVDVKRLVSGMAELIASTSGPRVDVRVDLAEDLPPAKADPNQLEMAVLNLAVNARDAMPTGGTLTISAARDSIQPAHRSKLPPGHYVRLSVADTGVGMDDATRQRAIEPFFSTKGIGKGTGLGLSMVHGLAAQLGGGLMIESALGQGTTVELWLPISAVAVGDDDQTSQPVAARKGLGTALLVDDEDLVRMSTADMLIDLGYEVVEANSAEEALRLVGQGLAPDLLITDHLMPGMSGVELARNMRSSRPEMPVLVVSGYAEAEGLAPDIPRLTKPFRNAELALSLSALMPGVPSE